MANGDYGYFGKGDTGYAQYMTAFNRNFAASSPLRWWSCWCLLPWEAEGIPTVQSCLW